MVWGSKNALGVWLLIPKVWSRFMGKKMEKCSFDHRWHFWAPPNMLVFVSFCAHVGEANGFKLFVFVVALDPQSIQSYPKYHEDPPCPSHHPCCTHTKREKIKQVIIPVTGMMGSPTGMMASPIIHHPTLGNSMNYYITGYKNFHKFESSWKGRLA